MGFEWLTRLVSNFKVTIDKVPTIAAGRLRTRTYAQMRTEDYDLYGRPDSRRVIRSGAVAASDPARIGEVAGCRRAGLRIHRDFRYASAYLGVEMRRRELDTSPGSRRGVRGPAPRGVGCHPGLCAGGRTRRRPVSWWASGVARTGGFERAAMRAQRIDACVHMLGPRTPEHARARAFSRRPTVRRRSAPPDTSRRRSWAQTPGCVGCPSWLALVYPSRTKPPRDIT